MLDKNENVNQKKYEKNWKKSESVLEQHKCPAKLSENMLFSNKAVSLN